MIIYTLYINNLFLSLAFPFYFYLSRTSFNSQSLHIPSCGSDTDSAFDSPCPLCIVLQSSSVNANVCLTAALLSRRHIHRSAAHSPSTHPEAVWVSEWEWAPVVFSCLSLCGTPLAYYLFDKRGLWKVHVSFCDRILHKSSVSIFELREMVHMFLIMEEHSRSKCVTPVSTSVGSLLTLTPISQLLLMRRRPRIYTFFVLTKLPFPPLKSLL